MFSRLKAQHSAVKVGGMLQIKNGELTGAILEEPAIMDVI